MSTHQDDIQHIVEFVNRTRVGMLSTREATGKLVSRPMTVVDVAPGEDLNFFTSRDTSSVRDVAANDAVNVAFVGDHEWVSISGAAEVVEGHATLVEEDWLEEQGEDYADEYWDDVPEGADDAYEPFGAAPGGHDFQGDLVEADLDVVGGHPDVSGHREFGAAAERVTVESGQHRSGKRFDAVADRPHPEGHRRGLLLGSQCAEFLEVAAGDEGFVACSGEGQRSSPRGAVERLVELIHGLQRDRIARVRSVDGDGRQTIVDLEVDHRAFSLCGIGILAGGE